MTVKSRLIPMVVDKSAGGERAYDIYSRLLKDRIVFVGGEIDDDSANAIIAQLLFLQAQNREKEIAMYINSPGKDLRDVEEDTDRDHFMSALEAKEWGIVDAIL